MAIGQVAVEETDVRKPGATGATVLSADVEDDLEDVMGEASAGAARHAASMLPACHAPAPPAMPSCRCS